MDQYNTPTQKTPSKGLHYIFYVDAQQNEYTTARTTITYQGAKYNMDVKFDNGLCNCAPSKIEGYGKYAWTKGSAERLKNIPKLPDELFEMIKKAPQPTTPAATTTTITKKGRSGTNNHGNNNGNRHHRRSYRISRLSVAVYSVSQLDNYSQLGSE